MLKKTAIWMTVLLAGSLAVSAGAAPAPKAPAVRKPIVCKWTTLQGMRYYYDGVEVGNDQSLKNLISPLKDAEADRLLALSSSSHTAGVGFLIGGTVFLASGVVLAADNYDSGSRSFNSTGTVGIVVGLAGLVGNYIGAFKLMQSKTSEFAAVQRYNAIVHGDIQTSWNIPANGVRMDLLAWNF